MSKKDIFFGHD